MPLIAAPDPGNWIGVLVFILVMFFSVISQILAKAKQAQQNQPRRPENLPPPAAGQRAAGGGDRLSSEINDFLDRAAQRRQPGSPPRPAVASRPRPARPPRPARREEPVEVVVLERSMEVSVDEHVRERLATPQFGRVGSKLGQEVAQSDEKLEHRLKSVFDHQVGRLANVPGEAARASMADEPPEARMGGSPLGLELAALLADPAGMRQAILVSEILRRPTERWSRP
jgi:hypothetical protein